MKKITTYCDICGKELTEETRANSELHFHFTKRNWNHTERTKCDKNDLCINCATKIENKLHQWCIKEYNDETIY